MENEMIKTIKEHGIIFTAGIVAENVNQTIASEDVAIQFILEELEAASQGNQLAQEFAFNSGFDEDDYFGAMYNSFEEVDGVGGPQQTLLNYCSMLMFNMILATELRIKVVDNIMEKWKLGKFAAVDKSLRLVDVVKKMNNLDEGTFANINNDLNDSITENHNIMILMAYGYARRTVAAGLFLQGIFSKEKYLHARNIFKSLQLKTGHSVEFQENAAGEAIELLKTYDSNITKSIISKLVSLAEKDDIDNDQEISYQTLIKMFME